ncbi:hypothetical protein F2981_25495 (plasmid) [Sinorhizobium meliloti]|nr:hypothetical protein [Sinorhizobium meliloti]
MERSLIAGLITFSAGAAALDRPAFAAETIYPLTLENCGRQITFDKTPNAHRLDRPEQHEILYLLGLADKVAGTALLGRPRP